MMCACILRSHATPTEGAFLFRGESCVLIFRHVICAVFGVFGYENFLFFRFCVHAGRGVTLLIPLYEVLVVPEVTQLLFGIDPDLAEVGLVAEQLLLEEVPVRDEHVLVHLEGDAVGPVEGGVAGGDGSRGLRDIFRHRAAENGVIFDSVESVQPA